MKKSALGKLLGAVLILPGCIALAGCPNPNNIGVQTYGVVQVTCLQASNNQPVAGALASIGIVTGNTNSSGVAMLSQVPIGTSIPVSCNAPGLGGSSVVPSLTADNTNTNPAKVTVLLSPS